MLNSNLANIQVKAISHSSQEPSASYPCRHHRKRPRPELVAVLAMRCENIKKLEDKGELWLSK